MFVEINRHHSSHHHGADFAPRADAPPVPAQDINRSSPYAKTEHDLLSLANRMQLRSDIAADQHHQDGEKPSHRDVVLLSFLPHHKTPVQIVHEIGDAP